jgi:hypothetical protein
MVDFYCSEIRLTKGKIEVRLVEIKSLNRKRLAAHLWLDGFGNRTEL